MKTIILFCCCNLFSYFSIAQNVGIGTATPLLQLHVAAPGTGLLLLDNTQTLVTDMADNFYFKTGSWFTGGIKTIGQSTNAARLGFFTYASTSSAGLLERMSITDDGNIGIGTTTPLYTLDVTGNLARTGNFVNNATSVNNYGVYGSCSNTPDYGYGVRANGGAVGVQGVADLSGPGSRYGLYGFGAGGTATNYGVYGNAIGGTNAYGVYGYVFGATNNWGGFFSGNVYTTGTYSSSDRKLKNDIKPLSGALSIINQLKPSVYTFKTNEYKQMNLPEGLQYGLIADEVQQVIPGAVKKAVQPAEYENHDVHNGKKLSDEVEFNAVNYTAMIPILIGAVKELNKKNEVLEKQNAELLKRIEALEKR